MCRRRDKDSGYESHSASIPARRDSHQRGDEVARGNTRPITRSIAFGIPSRISDRLARGVTDRLACRIPDR
jgi:hypothetical protein